MSEKYYVTIIVMHVDGTTEKSIYEYDDVTSAKSQFHKQIGGWMVKEDVFHVLGMVFNEYGNQYIMDVYHDENKLSPVEPETEEATE